MRLPDKVLNILPPKIATLIKFELGTYQSFWRLVANKRILKVKESQNLVFGYSEMQSGMLWMFQFASMAEIVAIELLVKNETLRLILLILGIWSVLLLLGIWASFKTNPHEIDSEFIYIRQGILYDIKIPKSSIKEITQINSRDYSKCRLVNKCLYLPVMNETNMRITLRQSISCELPWGMRGEIDEIFFYLDNARINIKYFL
jgi:hypothetical protein